MKLKIFTIRDAKLEDFAPPMFMQTAGQAIRSFSDEVNREDANNQLNKHSEDFALYELGIYDTETGTFETKNPEIKIRGDEVKNRNTEKREK